MKNYNIVVVGGGPAGVVTAVTARKIYSDKKIVLIRNVEKPLIPCGIPYIYGTLGDIKKNIMADTPLNNSNVDIILGEVKEIDRANKTVLLDNNEVIKYEKLVLATGSIPFQLNIKGENLKGVYYIKKSFNHLANLKDEIEKAKNIVIIGGGFIGVEFADEIAKLENKNVTLIEMMDKILLAAFDKEFCEIGEEKLKSSGVKILTKNKVVEILGDSKVKKIKLASGEEIDADVVIIAIGGKANSKLAKDADLLIGKFGAIWTDEYMRTTDENIFAVGDCAEKKDFFTRKPSNAMLASIATAEARIAGMNLYKLKVLRLNYGTISIFSTAINDYAFGAAGMTESNALKEGFEIVTGNFETVDKHPGSMPESRKLKVKLVFSKDSGILLGGQVSGGITVGEMINLIGLAIQSKMSATEIITFQIGTHPRLTSAPTVYPIIKAAENALMLL